MNIKILTSRRCDDQAGDLNRSFRAFLPDFGSGALKAAGSIACIWNRPVLLPFFLLLLGDHSGDRLADFH